MIHQQAAVHESAKIGKGVKIWNWAQVREHAEIGDNCVISKGVYIDTAVKVGKNVKIQNNVSLFHGVTVEDGVFIGPHVCFTNDMRPRAINPYGSLKDATDWQVTPTILKYGCSIGANSTILCGADIGRFAMVGAGAVVTKAVPDYGLVVGCPAKLIGYVCRCGRKLRERQGGVAGQMECVECSETVQLE